MINLKTLTNYDFESYTLNLNSTGSSYITLTKLPDEISQLTSNKETFTQLWNLHPAERHKIIMHEKEVTVSRYSKSYLQTPTDLSHLEKSSYMYSGFDTTQNNNDLPPEFTPFYEFMKNKDERYNQVIANWYEPSDYIEYHLDCQRCMIKDSKISILSLYPDINSTRDFKIIPKYNTNSDYIYDKIVIPMDYNIMVTMGGDTQQNFRHSIRKSTDKSQRISLSFRQMEQTL